MDQASRAVRLLDNGKFRSVRQTAAATGVPRTTLRDRLNGKPPRSQTDLKHSRLSIYQEKVLVQYIRDLQLQYAPVNSFVIASIATLLARQNEPSATLDKNWVSRFITRHSELRRGRCRSFEKSRIEAAIPSQIVGWYGHLEEIILRFNIAPKDIWNMDEIGYQMSHSQKESVVFDRRTGPPLSIASGSTGWVSILESISASGTAMTPLVIHRGKLVNTPLDKWFPPSKICPN